MKDIFGNNNNNRELNRLDNEPRNRDNNRVNSPSDPGDDRINPYRKDEPRASNDQRETFSGDRGNVGTMERGTATSTTRDSGYPDKTTDTSEKYKDNHDDDKVIVGIFETENQAINVVNRLKEIGYHEDDITVVAKDDDKMERLDDATDINTKTQGDTGAKVGAGAAIGGALGGIAAALPALGLLAVPGIGPLLAAGPIATILAGVVAGGVAGGLVGALVELGVREEDAKEYEQQIEQGKILILVENREDQRNEVHRTFKQNDSIIANRYERR